MFLKVVHGTVTEVPLWEDHVKECMKFDNLNYDHEDAKTKAVYFTDDKPVCQFFSDEKMIDPSTSMQTVITADVLSEKPYIMDKNPTDTHFHKGVQYLWPEERDMFYDNLRDEGYDAVVIESGYSNKGVECSDIAVLDVNIIKAKTVSYKINDKWTPDMDKEDAQNLLIRISNDPDIIEQSYEVYEREMDDNPLYGY